MSNEKMREEFEVWYADSVGLDASDIATWRRGEGYQNSYERCAISWLAWSACRAAIVIELPEPYAVIGDYAVCGGGRSVWDVDYAEKIDDRMCQKTEVYDRASLEAAGFKVKP